MMYAHRAEDGRMQPLSEHLYNVAELCAGFAAPFHAEQEARLTGLLHDVGKYSEEFQARLAGGPKADHSTAGAYECFARRSLAGAFSIAGHHGRLPELGTRDDLQHQPTLFGRMNRARQGLLPQYSAWNGEIELPPFKPPVFHDAVEEFFYIRMLYSCLVDADWLDTERFMLGDVDRGGCLDIPALDALLRQRIAGFWPPEGDLNGLRCSILDHCIRSGEEHKPGLFTLTVPTGGGKTLASLAFALRHAAVNGLRRVIYVIPYTSIIEQTAEVFRQYLGAENVLEYHSGAVFDTEEDVELQPGTVRRTRAAENWDMPVVVTTAVQFFESLYSDRPSRCRRLHSIAGSVVIFDEAQMLPVPYLGPCVSAIDQLVSHFGVTAVLCTATQPVLQPVFSRLGSSLKAVELCPPGIDEHPAFQRVTYRQAGELDWDQLAAELSSREQVLCVVNSRNNALEVFRRLDDSSSYHLSALMCPAHRQQVLDEIRRRLREGLPCRVVSTSLIEAGVDVDFPCVYRELAGLDSVIQAAGRCNREGSRRLEYSTVTVFQSAEKVSDQTAKAASAAKFVLMNCGDPASSEAVHRYFGELLDYYGDDYQDQKHILPMIRRHMFPYRTVAQRFHLIDESTRTVYVPYDAEGRRLISRLQAGDMSRSLFRQLGRCGVPVYEQQFRSLRRAGVLEVLFDGESAVLLDPSLYSSRTGLALHSEQEGS